MSNPAYGGQALIEGVMMRGPGGFAMAVRNQAGEIEERSRPLPATSAFNRIPVLRGIFGLGQALKIGMDAMRWAASVYARDRGIKLEAPSMRFTVLMGALIAVLIAFVIPHGASWLYHPRNPVATAAEQAVIRFAIVLAYVWAVGRMPDVTRLFQYHGAEHKSIACLEAGLPLTVANARAQSRLHPRCGTGFIFIMVAILGLIEIGLAAAGITGARAGVLRLLALPLVPGLGYELLRLGGQTAEGNRWLVAPLLWSQLLTTREPDDQQLEVALGALQSAQRLELDGQSPA